VLSVWVTQVSKASNPLGTLVHFPEVNFTFKNVTQKQILNKNIQSSRNDPFSIIGLEKRQNEASREEENQE